MKRWFTYSPLGRLADLKDDGTGAILSIPFKVEDKECEVSLLGNEDRFTAIRVAIPGDGNLSEKEQSAASAMTQHLLSVIRLVVDHSIAPALVGANFLSFGTHSDEQGSPTLSIRITVPSGPMIDAANVVTTFNATANKLRPFTRLLADATSPHLPPQFRFLSVYKIFELEFNQNRKWPGFRKFAEPFEAEFAGLALSQRLIENFLHDFRDRCAHIRLGSDNAMGVTGLDPKDHQVVQTIMPLLVRMIATLAKERHDITLVTVDELSRE